MKHYTAREIAEIVGEPTIDEANRWLAEGSGIAVYVNQDLGSPTVGDKRIFRCGPEDPSEQLPDYPGEINWRYRLEGIYRGALLDKPSSHDWTTPIVVMGRLVEFFGERAAQYRLEVIPRTAIFTFEVERSTITIEATLADSEVDRLGEFTWTVRGHGASHGTATGLGDAMVRTYNNTMEAK